MWKENRVGRDRFSEQNLGRGPKNIDRNETLPVVLVVRSLYARAMDLLLLLDASTPFEFCGARNTYFVPTDRAFKKLGPAELRRMFNSASCLRDVLDGHRADRIVPSALIKERWQYEIRTKNAAIVRVASSGGGKLTVNTFDVLAYACSTCTRAAVGWHVHFSSRASEEAGIFCLCLAPRET